MGGKGESVGRWVRGGESLGMGIGIWGDARENAKIWCLTRCALEGFFRLLTRPEYDGLDRPS